MALATDNLGSRRLQFVWRRANGPRAFSLWFLSIVGWGLQMYPILAGAPASEIDFAAYVQANYQEAARLYQQAPGNAEAAWQFGRACFDLAELATNRTARAAIAERGIAACRQVIARASNLAPAHYYLGMNLAQSARTKGLGALKLVNEMEREFALTRRLDAQFDFAGSDRNLGLLYRDAPAIGSIGSRANARQHLRRAVELAPEYPENRLNLIEAYLKWGDREGGRRELQAVEALWPDARTNFVGVAWTASWADWERRLEKARGKLGRPSPKS